MAKTGYGKRSVGGEDPHADPDFAHLLPRDAEFAVFIDHLDDGHAMGYKVIAAEHPHHGQQASRVSMGRITLAGHLRWIKEHITVEDNSMRWVTRTYWSRTRRSPEWWANFARERHAKDVTEHYQSGLARVEQAEGAEETEATAVPAQQADQVGQADQVDQVEPDEQTTEQPSAAYQTLTEVSATDARMALSDRDCRSLEALATDWLSRGATPHDITKALTDGLPPAVTNPGGLARNRLESKMPPKKAKVRQKAGRRAVVSRVIMACGLCDADERTEKIVNGLCRECLALCELEGPVYEPVPETFLPGPRGGGLPGADEVVDVTARVESLRRAAGLAPGRGSTR
ncbi:hypothetical protein FNH08_47695 [Streptomyces spongiae]|uniref:Uncharacterized protein n=2 Tax=Streptomyces spongiae TaxID=565072 RepID=A0A5N8XYX0_9ACTN|nr:hypothetical protein [Streptomyces spongiae]